jgi:hypothetical protein
MQNIITGRINHLNFKDEKIIRSTQIIRVMHSTVVKVSIYKSYLSQLSSLSTPDVSAFLMAVALIMYDKRIDRSAMADTDFSNASNAGNIHISNLRITSETAWSELFNNRLIKMKEK